MSNRTREVGDGLWRGGGKLTETLFAVAIGINTAVSAFMALLRRVVSPQVFAVAVVATLGMAEPSFAAGGFTQITSVANNINTMLVATSVIAVTIAIMIAGYKIAFSGARFQDVWGFLLGGVLIGGAAGLAAWITTPQ